MEWRTALRGASLRFYLALGFLLWSILPHFSLLVHAHSEDGEGHNHTLLSASQVDLAEALTDAAAEAYGQNALHPDFGKVGKAGKATGKSAASHPEWGPRGFLLHGHYHEDANVLATVQVPITKAVQPTPVQVPQSLPRPPDDPDRSSFQARGPPSSLA